jgi:thymidylate synthase (FAD)
MPLTPEQKDEIDRARAQSSATRRATVPALEEVLYEAVPVLDHGFVRVIDYMGDDGAVVQAARVSYGRGTRKVSEDKALIFYLLRHRHTTPFEMCEIKYHVKLPIFVARQWIRHRTANVNEYSARYSILDNEFYLPAPEQLAVQSSTNRQGRGDVLAPAEARRVLDLLREDSERAYKGYVELLNEDEQGRPVDPARSGIARAVARGRGLRAVPPGRHEHFRRRPRGGEAPPRRRASGAGRERPLEARMDRAHGGAGAVTSLSRLREREQVTPPRRG